MSEFAEAAWLWAAKAAGAVAGSAISLAYILPNGRREAGIRFAVGIVSGLVFGGTAGLKIASELGIDKMLNPGELMLMGSAAASLCAWWALGLGSRLFERMGRDTKLFKHTEERK
ncbi:DUF6107 family protein [Aquamicrobium sp. LC103]|uniref:DUF6107 family protein n=1 Tax=Aquamicrobium sp. LC103 TaxID=1120658 RepID=UPI00063ECEC9|nr:DUF6107 family protein [Aquamicrobium sp. LC103]TKT81223.1 hypothetical protein XW59_004975 [Aquamicrobium sp. LC103]